MSYPAPYNFMSLIGHLKAIGAWWLAYNCSGAFWLAGWIRVLSAVPPAPNDRHPLSAPPGQLSEQRGVKGQLKKLSRFSQEDNKYEIKWDTKSVALTPVKLTVHWDNVMPFIRCRFIITDCSLDVVVHNVSAPPYPIQRGFLCWKSIQLEPPLES